MSPSVALWRNSEEDMHIQTCFQYAFQHHGEGDVTHTFQVTSNRNFQKANGCGRLVSDMHEHLCHCYYLDPHGQKGGPAWQVHTGT
jgi:hypothetical protein